MLIRKTHLTPFQTCLRWTISAMRKHRRFFWATPWERRIPKCKRLPPGKGLMMRSVPWYWTENRGKTASRSLSKHLPLPSIESTCPKERSLMMAPGCLMTLSLHACIGPRTAPGLVFALQLNRENIFTKSNYNGRTQRLQPRMA